MRYSRNRMSSQKAHGIALGRCETGFVSTHQAIRSAIDKNNGIGLECLCEPFIGSAYSTRPAGLDGKHRRLAVAFCQPPRQMHLREIFGRSGLWRNAPKRGSRILGVREAKRSG